MQLEFTKVVREEFAIKAYRVRSSLLFEMTFAEYCEMQGWIALGVTSGEAEANENASQNAG